MKTITNKLDLYVAYALIFICLTLSIILFITGNLLQSILFGFVMIACASYLLAYKYHKDQIYSPTRVHINPILLNFLQSAFYFTLSIAILLFIYRPDMYSRPIAYFICIGFIAVIIGVQIAYAKDNIVTGIILQIILLGIFVRWVQITVFPGHVWFDPWFHGNFIDNLIKIGEDTRFPRISDLFKIADNAFIYRNINASNRARF